jgi:hypothetical protein
MTLAGNPGTVSLKTTMSVMTVMKMMAQDTTDGDATGVLKDYADVDADVVVEEDDAMS